MRRLAPIALALCVAPACDSGPPPIRISEIHYHPVLEDSYEERHEFVELYNAADTPVAIGGWRLEGETLSFVFPRGSYIEPGDYRVVAKDRAALAPVWGLDEAMVFGDYAGALDNGDDEIRLIDDHDDEVDAVKYEDSFPWPVGPDGLGASDKWLDADLMPMVQHRYRGYSLERVALDLPPQYVENWAPSHLDGMTPGRPNSAAAEVPLPIVYAFDRAPVGPDHQITVSFTRSGVVAAAELEWFVDDLSTTGEPTTRVPLVDIGQRQFRAVIPAVPDRSIVRYRVHADRGAGLEVVSPRASDPYRWHAFAVLAPVASNTRVYHIEISPAAWGQMWNNVAAGRDDGGCTVNPNWDNEVPAVVIYNGEVYDVLVRYQGSRYNRLNGLQIPSWPHAGPSAGPNPPLAQSWHIDFPRYHRLEKRGTITLSKNNQGCPGFDASVGFALFRSVGIPASRTRYARLFINGGYYHYMLDIERPGEEMMKQYGPVGDLFKSAGGTTDGAFGIGDERVLGPQCGLTPLQRYTITYDRKTHGSWGRQDELVYLIEDLNRVRAMGPAAERAFFAERFDVEKMLTYMAVINWSVPFDDQFQNHFLYRQQNGTWHPMPWDLDLNFGTWNGAAASLYIGEEGDPDNRGGYWNVVKDAFLDSYRPEYEARLRALVDGPLAPAAVHALVDEAQASADWAEAAASPVGVGCDPVARAASFKQFATDRQAVVKARLP